MAREYSRKLFTATINGVDYTFSCHTTDTRNGFCHTCYDFASDRTSKVSYYNRTWECFEYETVLRRAIDKYPKAIREELHAQLIDSTRKAETERCERQIEQFKRLHEGLTDKQKEILAQAPPMQSEEDVQRTMGVMSIFNVLNNMDASK